MAGNGLQGVDQAKEWQCVQALIAEVHSHQARGTSFLSRFGAPGFRWLGRTLREDLNFDWIRVLQLMRSHQRLNGYYLNYTARYARTDASEYPAAYGRRKLLTM
jgi:hypothetical protein